MGPIPPPFPNGKGACCVMSLLTFHSKATFVSGGISFSPLGETGEGFPCFALQSRHASQKHHPRSNRHKRKTSTRKRTAPRYDSRREDSLTGIACE